MPTMASITVKKKDGTTDIVYDALSASGGEDSPAVWRQDTGAASTLPVGFRNLFRLWSAWNKPRTARVMRFHIVMPFVTTDYFGAAASKDRVVFEGSVVIPQAIPSSNIGEAVYQGLNLLGSTLMKQSSDAGYAPN